MNKVSIERVEGADCFRLNTSYGPINLEPFDVEGLMHQISNEWAAWHQEALDDKEGRETLADMHYKEAKNYGE